MSQNSTIEELLISYIQLLKRDGELDESYKWEAIEYFRTHWDINALDFAEMFNESFKKQRNLFYHMSLNFIKTAVEYKPDEVRQMFVSLFDENLPIKERIQDFQSKSKELESELRRIKNDEKINHQQDERTISVYLAFRYPEKYYIYKNGIYQKLCKALDIKFVKTGKRFLHYSKLAEKIKTEYIINNSVLYDLHRSIYPKVDWDDSNLLTQNFLYCALNKTPIEPSYWIFQGNPNIYRIVDALNAGHLTSWKVNGHKDKIKIGDKVILWQTGSQAGCYALAEVISEVGLIKEGKSENEYYVSEPTSDDSNQIERVRIKILKNLANSPILWQDVREDPRLSSFKAGSQGTNFSATEEEYLFFENLTHSVANLTMEEKDFIQFINQYDKTDVTVYYEFLDQIIQEFNLTEDDERFVLNVRKNRLIFTVGQRYAWILYSSDLEKGKYGLISADKINENSETFDGKPLSYFNRLNEFDQVLNIQRSAFQAISDEFYRTRLSGHRKHNNDVFRKTVFDIDYRNELLDMEFNSINDQTINVKKEFTQWLIRNPKADYFNNESEKIEEFLDRYNSYFDIDIFKCSKNNYRDVIDVIEEQAYLNEDSEFFKYSEKESNHRPRAILGKRNYYRFLEEKFDKLQALEEDEALDFPLNQILYGPPGTGKTYELQSKYFKYFTIKESSLSRKQYLENLIADKSWGQVLGAILYDLEKASVAEILNHELLKIKESISNSKNVRATIWGFLAETYS